MEDCADKTSFSLGLDVRFFTGRGDETILGVGLEFVDVGLLVLIMTCGGRNPAGGTLLFYCNTVVLSLELLVDFLTL